MAKYKLIGKKSNKEAIEQKSKKKNNSSIMLKRWMDFKQYIWWR